MLNERIKLLRLNNNLTQKDLASKLGLTPKMISFYELGDRVPPPDMLEKLADIFHVSTDYLLGRDSWTICPICGRAYDPLNDRDSREHDAVHTRFLKAEKQFGNILSSRDANALRDDSISRINSPQSSEDDVVKAFDDCFRAEFALSLRHSEFDLSHVSYNDFCAIQLEKWDAKDAVSDELYEKLQNIYGVPNTLDYYPVSANRKHGVTINVLGRVAAGIPIEAIEDIIDTEEITEEMAKTGSFFGLKIKGSSMTPIICDGDVVIVRQQEDAESGEIVVATVNGHEAFCKRLRKYRDGIGLISENPDCDSYEFTNQQIAELPVRIVGKVVESRRKF